MHKLLKKIRDWYYRDKDTFNSMLEQLKSSAQSNWENNMRPQDMADQKTYTEFFIGSHIACYRVGRGEYDK